MAIATDLSNPQQLLDAYPLIRSRSEGEARELIGQVLSPHHLRVRGDARRFEARHNQVRLGRVAINVLSYGAEVEIDPGERGNFYLLQLPLAGSALVRCNDQEARVGPEVMSVLQPCARTRMVWSGDCTMIMLQVPVLAPGADGKVLPVRSLTRSRHDPAVAAWWQAVADMTSNLHHHGGEWLGHPAAATAMESFLLAGLDLLRPRDEPDGTAGRPAAGDPVRLQRAIDHIHAHAAEVLTLQEIADAACMSPRALEAAFRRHHHLSPLAYARGVRLDLVHAALQAAARQGRPIRLIDLALRHGFAHMGRFAAYYRQRFGQSPSATLRA